MSSLEVVELANVTVVVYGRSPCGTLEGRSVTTP